jgi:hypothetical protein
MKDCEDSACRRQGEGPNRNAYIILVRSSQFKRQTIGET